MTSHYEQVLHLYQQAQKLADAGHYVEAENALTQALEFTESVEIHLSRGEIHAAQGNHKKAIEDYQQAIALDPFIVEGWINLGVAYNEIKEFHQCLSTYNHALTLTTDPLTLALIYYNKAYTLESLLQLQESLLCCNQAIALDPQMENAYLNRGNVHARLFQEQAARADYAQALLLAPGDIQIAWTVTWSQFDSQPPAAEEIIPELQRIAQLDPAHYVSLVCQGVQSLLLLDLESAQILLQQAADKEPDQWDPPFWLSLLAMLQGDERCAHQELEKAKTVGLPPLFLAPLSWPSLDIHEEK